MARILSVLPHAGGNVAPTLAVARELAARGHHLRFLGHGQLRDTVEREGFGFVPFDSARPWSAVVDEPGVRSMLAWLSLASDRGTGRDLQRELARDPADLVLVDCMLPGALPAARTSGLPVVVILHAFWSYWNAQWAVGSPMGLWLRVARLRPTTPGHRADLALLLTEPELDVVPEGASLPARRLVQTGAVLSEQPRDGRGDRADALISLSTISYPGQVDVLERLVAAIAELPVSAIVTTGPSIDPGRLAHAPNVEVHRFVPHADILPNVRLLVGHGGHGTTMAALAHDVPVLVVPMSSHADHALVGEAVARAGAGALVSKHASRAELQDAIRDLLDSPSARVAAARLGRRIRESRGAVAAADEIEQVLGNSLYR